MSQFGVWGGYECPTCGRDDFDREVDMKAHHTIAHGESLVGSDASAFAGDAPACPSCGRDDFANTVAMRAHHTIVHGEQLSDSTRSTDSTRQVVLDRDEYTCQRCEVAVSSTNEAGPDYNVHHIIPRAAGGPDHPDNLITLCTDCHTEVHRELETIVDDRPDVLDTLRSFLRNISE
ncbi:hypothetical protein GS429_02460 [Natronorubrum sp. JWXQ-INN-674]|uniref:HNH nuclease domain-containing protein n=2 Tax=Natronorubrum halalkaliphilum TaxID=2691917 RepID=A0A6B0VK70_9EURY|nr:hypothetical protein [Natronorubrum halalkaliphilum]